MLAYVGFSNTKLTGSLLNQNEEVTAENLNTSLTFLACPIGGAYEGRAGEAILNE
jgi:hypothetical protein